MKHAIGAASVVIVVALAFLVARWIEENYVPRPVAELPSGPFHNAGYRQTAENALRRLSRLSATEQAVLRKNLEGNIIGVSSWLDSLRKSKIRMLCLGEDHEDSTRRFLARAIFSELRIDGLMLEVTTHQLGRIDQELRWGRGRVALLGANIANVIRAARRRSPDMELIGIEETKSQRIARQKHGSRGTRDESIQNNFWRHFRYGRRHVILFGALHCMDRDEWLYSRTRRLAPTRVVDEMVNVRVLERHQEGAIEALAYFLGKIGIDRDDFVVVDSQAVHPLIFEWFESTTRKSDGGGNGWLFLAPISRMSSVPHANAVPTWSCSGSRRRKASGSRARSMAAGGPETNRFRIISGDIFATGDAT